MSDQRRHSAGRAREQWYEIRVGAELDARWSAWFDGLALKEAGGGETTITGPVVDDAALHGLLTKVRDLGLPLVSVRRVGRDQEPAGPDDDRPDPAGQH
jgi:hypothetical protein